MRKYLFVALAAALGSVAAAGDAEAQLRPWEISIAGGPSFTTGDFSEVAGTGYHVQGSIGFGVPMLPFGVRVDALWQEVPAEVGDEYYRQIGGLVNATFGVPLVVIEPYGLVGAGYISTDSPFAQENEANIGFNAGLGLEFPFMGLAGFAEARYLNLLGGDEAKAFQSIPVSVGIRF